MKKEYFFSSQRLIYRTITESDAKQMSIWRSDYRIIRYFKNPVKVSESDQLKWFNNIYLHDLSRFDFLVLCDDNPVGFVSLSGIQNCIAEVGYAIGNPLYHNKGLSKEMIGAICKFGSLVFDIKEFIAVIHRDNIASIKAASSVGFCQKSVSGDFLIYKRIGTPNVNIDIIK